MDSIYSNFSGVLPRELFNLIVGKKLGSGVARDVFEYLPDPKFVIKFENSAGSFQNVKEWEFWRDAKYHPSGIKKWLAPCQKISGCGTILIQQRTEPLPKNKYPERIPSVLADTKYGNYGVIGSQFVCHDYGCTDWQVGLTKRMYKPEWWGE